MRILATAVLLVAIAGCARPPKISANLTVTRRTPDMVLLMLRIKNLEDRATTPVAAVVSVQLHSDGAWSKATDAIKPAPFVLNKKEQRDIFKVLHTNADLVRATLTIKAQETGRVLLSERIEQAPGSPFSTPAPNQKK